ncbi:MAG TPA: serine hydrolase [Thermoleophilaceae bacterium]|nr:serine hydrolase [Thermoleophilaceae bacterium]
MTSAPVRPRRRYLLRRLVALSVLVGVLGAAGWLLASRGGDERVAPAAAASVPPIPRPSLPVDGGSFGADPSALTARRGLDLDGQPAFSLRFRKPPRAGLVFDLASGAVLWQHRAQRELPVASLTKMMTALLVVEETSPRDRVRIAKAALNFSGSGVGRLPKGRHVPIEALLHGLLLPSGNDAAIALAIHLARSEERFVERMNARAAELGLPCTRFVSSHGLERGNRSCAADMAALARLDMAQVRIRRVVRKREAVLRFPIKGGKLFLNNTNPLLRARYPGTIGLKTGFTNAAGRSLVAVVERRGRTLGVVLIGSPAPGLQARRLLNRAFRAR